MEQTKPQTTCCLPRLEQFVHVCVAFARKHENMLCRLMLAASVLMLLAAANFARAETLLPPPSLSLSPAAVQTEEQHIALPVFNKTIRKGVTIEATDIVYENTPARMVSPMVVVQAKNIVGMETTRSVPKGTPIFANSLRQPPAVRRNDRVAVLFNTNGVSLRTRAVAMEDATLGAVVKLRNMTSGKVIVGTVIATNTVEIR